MSDICVSQIVAMAKASRAIGKDNKLLWHIPEDLKHFKRTTLGKPIIMGRKTYDSVGFPLPGRTNIIISRDASLRIEGALVVPSCEAAEAKRCCREQGVDELFIAGGAEIYRQTLPLTDKIYLSQVDADVAGDTSYPVLAPEDWCLNTEQLFDGGSVASSFTLQVLVRR